jgi:predicted phage terminase large subunit-like protein
MFKVDRFAVAEQIPPNAITVLVVRYWDKAATDPEKEGKFGAYTVGTKMALVKQVGLPMKYYVMDVVRGQWGAEERERIIRATAEADGRNVVVWMEQEPGSGGKESARATISNLAGYSCYAEPVDTNKVARADQFSVQVNNGNVVLLRGDWNQAFKDEYALFPFSKNKDQVDSGSGAFRKLTQKKIARVIGGRSSR